MTMTTNEPKGKEDMSDRAFIFNGEKESLPYDMASLLGGMISRASSPRIEIWNPSSSMSEDCVNLTKSTLIAPFNNPKLFDLGAAFIVEGVLMVRVLPEDTEHTVKARGFAGLLSILSEKSGVSLQELSEYFLTNHEHVESILNQMGEIKEIRVSEISSRLGSDRFENMVTGRAAAGLSLKEFTSALEEARELGKAIGSEMSRELSDKEPIAPTCEKYGKVLGATLRTLTMKHPAVVMTVTDAMKSEVEKLIGDLPGLTTRVGSREVLRTEVKQAIAKGVYANEIDSVSQMSFVDAISDSNKNRVLGYTDLGEIANAKQKSSPKI